ncbi:MAG: M14 family zinc carboxypeptidase [bacterium]
MSFRSCGWSQVWFRVGLVLTFAYLVGLPAIAAQAADIPLDKNGLPCWIEREYGDFPVRIELRSSEELDALLKAIPIASFNREQISFQWDTPKQYRLIFEPRVTAAEADALIEAGYLFEPLPDLERQVRKEMERVWAEQAKTGGDKLARGEKGVYHTHAQIGTILQQVETDHPTLADFGNIGASVQGRDLWMIRISDNITAEEAEPEIRLSSTMHGNEPPGLEMLLFLVDYLTDNYGVAGFEDVTYLVDNYDIYIVPCHNPDGLAAGTRANANGIDINRNFPVPNGNIGGDGTWTEEIETILMKNFGFAHHFVIGEDGHAGALVVNYPWDYQYALTPDDAAIIKMSLEYSTYNLPMYNGSFTQGIVRGCNWYVTEGSLQDWSYEETDCIHVIIEYHNLHTPPASYLDGLWDENRESFMHWIKSARYGINGVVTGSDTGSPLDATIVVSGNDKWVHTDPSHGDYYKLLDTGSYDLTFSATGYISETHYGVATTWGTPTVLDVDLDPVAHGDIGGTVTAQGGAGLDANIEVRTHPGDVYVTAVTSDAGSGGAYTVNLIYGEYKLVVSATGHITQEQVVTLDSASETANFILNIAEVAMLFSDDFEGGAGQWTGDWGLADPATGHGSSNSLTDSPGSDVKYSSYEDNPCTMSESVDLSTALSGNLTFWAKWDIETNWDCCFLQVSTNGGGDWTALATQYTEPASGQGAQLPVGTPLFEGSQANWVENSVDLSPWLGESDVRFRFHLLSDSSIQKDGFYVDDVEIQVIREPVSGVDVPLVQVNLAAYPNPFNPQTTLVFSLRHPGPVQLGIFDLQGRLVRRLVHEQYTAGDHEVVWDGRADDGRAAASGVYFARLIGSDERQNIKLMLVK